MDQRQDINIGGVTAYAYARSKGYTGTEAEFAQLMANIGNTQQEIDAAIDEFVNTTAPGAVQAVETAQASALEAIGVSKTDALDALNTSKGSAVAAVNSAGDTQKAAVDAEGQRVIDSIPADYTELTGEVDDLKSAINYLDADVTWSSGHFFNSYGAIIDYEPFSITDYIPLENNGVRSDVYFTVYGNTATYCVFYDANKTQLSVVQIGSKLEGSTVGVDGAAYVRLTNKNGETPLIVRNNYKNVVTNKAETSLPVSMELGTIGGTGSFADANFRMRTISRFSVPFEVVLTTDWTKYVIGLHREKDGVYEDVGWKRADIVLSSEYSYEFIVGRGDYSGTALSIAEQEEILSSTIIKGQIFMLSNKYKWHGKKWTCIGDSLTEQNTRTSKHYFDYVHNSTGIVAVNLGISGTGYANGDGASKQFYNRVSSVPLDSDVVTIFGSLNDLDSGLPLGAITDSDTTTIAGCINKTIDDLFAVFPLVNLGIVTPTPWQTYNAYLNNTASINYVQMLIDICKKRGIPCLDLYHCSGLRPWDADFRALAYTKDNGNGTHPDETGHKLIAPRFEAFLDALLLS